MSVQKDREVSAPVDGNAIAGLLRELFAFEATTANITCGGCGVAARIGEVRVYGSPMGAIFRCAHCDTAVIRLVRTSAGFWLDMRGARSLFVPASQQ